MDHTAVVRDDWKVSTPAEQGPDPMLVAELYFNAAELERLYGLLVVKNGYLIAEGYFSEGSIEQKTLLQSASKSYYSLNPLRQGGAAAIFSLTPLHDRRSLASH